jgi:hypothetical protein
MSKPYRFLRCIVATYLGLTGLYFVSSTCAEPLQAGLNTLTVKPLEGGEVKSPWSGGWTNRLKQHARSCAVLAS